MQKRIFIAYTGGTIGMRRTPQGYVPESGLDQLLAHMIPPDLAEDMPDYVLHECSHLIDSANLHPRDWYRIADLIASHYHDYDGFVVLHGTDTMAYTASALAFLLPGLDRSVVLTGSQRPLEDIRTDARSNLVDACQVATLAVPEVGVVFHSTLFRGCRAMKMDAWGMDAFGSPSCPPLAELGLGVHVGPHVLAARPVLPFDDRIEPRVLAVRTFPGLDPRLLHGALASGVRGVVIEAFGAGNVPRLERSLIPVIEAARGLDVPVVIVSQCPRGAVDLTAYEGGAAAQGAGAIGAGDMTAEAALTKLMITLGRSPAAGLASPGSGRVQAARDAFATAVVGEMTAR